MDRFERNGGAKAVLRGPGEAALAVAVDTPEVILDCDREADYLKLMGSHMEDNVGAAELPFQGGHKCEEIPCACGPSRCGGGDKSLARAFSAAMWEKLEDG